MSAFNKAWTVLKDSEEQGDAPLSDDEWYQMLEDWGNKSKKEQLEQERLKALAVAVKERKRRQTNAFFGFKGDEDTEEGQ